MCPVVATTLAVSVTRTAAIEEGVFSETWPSRKSASFPESGAEAGRRFIHLREYA